MAAYRIKTNLLLSTNFAKVLLDLCSTFHIEQYKHKENSLKTSLNKNFHNM